MIDMTVLRDRIAEAQRRRDRAGPTGRGLHSFGDLAAFLRAKLKRVQGPYGQIVKAWDELVGDMAPYTRPAGFAQGKLLVEVTSSAHLYELKGFRLPELLARLQADRRSADVAEIQFRLRTPVGAPLAAPEEVP